MLEKSFEELSINETRELGQWEIRDKNLEENSKAEKEDTLFDKTAKLVAGKNASDFDLEWVKSNIESIHQAVSGGKHETLYYPASGRDFLRILVAYDVSHLVTVDTEEQFKDEIGHQLDALGITYQMIQTDSPNKVEFIFELNGKQRKVTHITGDARIQNLETLGMKSVDILHVYLPTGADTPILANEVYLQEKYGDNWWGKRWDEEAIELMKADSDAPKPNPETGEYEVVKPAVDRFLDARNYQLVNEGGFFVLGENKIQQGDPLPALLKIAGLKEIPITSRHPFKVLTSMFPDKDELPTMDRTGYVYQKERVVSPQIIEIQSKILTDMFWHEYAFMEFERGNFEYMDIEDDEPIDIVATIHKNYKDFKDTVEAHSLKLQEAGIDVKDLETFKEEMLASFRKKIKKLQEQIRELLKTYQEVSQKYENGEVDDKQAKQEMGIVEINRYGSIKLENTKYPLAVQLIYGVPEMVAKTDEVTQQFAKAEFKLELR